MGSFVARVQALALALGAPGLFLAAFIDSSSVPLPEVVDLLVVLMVTRHKALLPLYVISSTVGSLFGCLVVYYVGRKGGEMLVRKRFSGATVDRALASVRRNGVLTVLVASLLPPPMPFKVFIFLAGAVEISVPKFVAAIVLGRGARYLALALLAFRYGDRAMTYVNEHGGVVGLAVVGVLAAFAVAYWAWTRTPAAPGR